MWVAAFADIRVNDKRISGTHCRVEEVRSDVVTDPAPGNSRLFRWLREPSGRIVTSVRFRFSGFRRCGDAPRPQVIPPADGYAALQIDNFPVPFSQLKWDLG